ncbi:unnamed protein product [[Candida] boidinii]|nr:unnamed protein product [[Candida] boidinii]
MTLTANFEGRGYGSSNEINENSLNTSPNTASTAVSNTTSSTHISNNTESRAVVAPPSTDDASSSTPQATPPIQENGAAWPVLPPKPTQDELVRSNTNTNFNSHTRSVPSVTQRSTQLQVKPPSVPSRSSQSQIPQPVFPERVSQAQRSTSGSGSPLQSNNPFNTGASVSVSSFPPPLLGVTDPNVSALYDPLPPFPIQNYANLGNIDFNNILGNTRTPIVPGFSRNDFPELIGDNGEMKIENFNDRYTEDNYNRANNDNNTPIEEEALGRIHDYKKQNAFNYTHEMIARNYPHAILQGQMSLGLTEAMLQAGMKKPNFDFDKITRVEDFGGVNERQLNEYLNHMVGVINDKRVQEFVKNTGMVNMDNRASVSDDLSAGDKEMMEKAKKSLRERGVIDVDLEGGGSGGGISGFFKKKTKKKNTIEFKPNKEVLELLKSSELYRNS